MDYQRENLKWSGWGRREHSFDLDAGEPSLRDFLLDNLGLRALRETPAPPIESLPLPESRLSSGLRASLTAIVGASWLRTDRYERVFHAIGRSYWDLLRLRSGELDHAPDGVVYPASVAELEALVRLGADAGLALVPFGGGSSVVGGVEACAGPGHAAVLTVDLSRLDRLLSVDPVSRLATAQAGIYGPALESGLQAQGFTLGHFPQSFEFSTLGGWVATRSTGQQSCRYGSAADMLQGAKLVTPSGTLEVSAHPGSATGPDLRQVVAGSEGILGFIAEATVRLRPKPAARDYRGFLFPDFASGAEAIRLLLQDDVDVAMLRLSDPGETHLLGQLAALGRPERWLQRTTRGALGLFGGRRPCLLLVGLEGSSSAVSSGRVSVARAVIGSGGLPVGAQPGRGWYRSRFRMPYVRDALLDHGIGVGAIETATVWSNVTALYRVLRDELTVAIRRVTDRGEGEPMVMAHISHAYPAGANLYFTFVFPIARRGARAQWRLIRRVAVETILSHGGTLSHHHGIGHISRDWLPAERGAIGVSLLRAIRHSVDPRGIMNPGKLLPTTESN